MPRHHMVPQMLLRRFADANERLYMVGREGSKPPIPSVVRKAGAQVGFYRMEADDLEPSARQGHDPELVEAIHSQIEGVAKPIIDRFCGGKLYETPTDRFRFAHFAAHQICRGEAFRSDLTAWVNAHARATLPNAGTDAELAAWLHERGHAADEQALKAFRQRMHTAPWQIVSGQASMVQQSLQHALETVLPELYFRHWKVLRFQRPVLLTSDTPLGYWSPNASAGNLPAALLTAQEVYFPLDRQTCLSFSKNKAADQVISVRAERARRINEVIATGAHRWIYHHPEDHPLEGITLESPGVLVHEVQDVRLDVDGRLSLRGILVKRPDASGDLD